jgi:hypothetical protein
LAVTDVPVVPEPVDRFNAALGVVVGAVVAAAVGLAAVVGDPTTVTAGVGVPEVCPKAVAGNISTTATSMATATAIGLFLTCIPLHHEDLSHEGTGVWGLQNPGQIGTDELRTGLPSDYRRI